MDVIFSSPTFNNLSALSNSIAARDKSVRAIQYGSRLIIGYYKALLSQESIQILQGIAVTASHARKIFRLCKSINSLKALVNVLRKEPCNNALDECCRVLNGFEQLFWTFFFYYDNLLLFSRLKMIPVSVKEMERKSYTCWFLADICKFSSALIKFSQTMRKYGDDELSDAISDNISTSTNLSLSIECSKNKKQLELQQSSWELVKAFLDVFVSGSFTPEMCDLTRTISRAMGVEHCISDGHVGACAVLSCLMNLRDQYQEIAKQ